jgi:hypothetical protein
VVNTRLSLRDIEFSALADDLRVALIEESSHRDHRTRKAEPLFRHAMSDVIRGIRARGRFELLKQFIAFGGFLPAWEKTARNSVRPVSDEDVGKCVDFIHGHMVSKFQGKLAEILAAPTLSLLLSRLIKDGRLPRTTRLIQGAGIRVRARGQRGPGRSDNARGIQGPDGLIVSSETRKRLRVHGVVEIKSMYVPPAKLRSQSTSHVASVARGCAINEKWFDRCDLVLGTGSHSGSKLLRVFVVPDRWRVPRAFHFEPSPNGGRALVMDHPVVPGNNDPVNAIDRWTWSIRLRWSRDALRGAAFSLAHRYMAEVGVALAESPEAGYRIRTDMAPSDTGPNDLLHQLHVAIFRQMECEPDPGRRSRTLELYNVFGFGWALGHAYRDADGKPRMLYPEDLDAFQGSRRRSP